MVFECCRIRWFDGWAVFSWVNSHIEQLENLLILKSLHVYINNTLSSFFFSIPRTQLFLGHQ